jgi:hypothetical protein
MLRALILENFKAFGGRRVIPIRPITLIFGPNSAGKSAILQSLLMLKQTINDPDTGDVPIRFKGSLVDLGSFRDVVFRNETDRVIEITPILEERDPAGSVTFMSTLVPGTDQWGLGVCIGKFDDGGIIVNSSPVYIGDTAEPLARVEFLRRSLSAAKNVLSKDYLAKHDIDHFHDLLNLASPVVNRAHDFWIGHIRSLAKDIQDKITDPDFGIDLIRTMSGTPLESFSTEEQQLMLDELKAFPASDYEDLCAKLDLIAEREPLIKRSFLFDGGYDRGRVLDHDSFDESEARRVQIYSHLFHGLTFDSAPRLSEIVRELSVSLRLTLQGLTYIGPLREHPARHYLFSGVSPANVGSSGLFTADLVSSRPGLAEDVNKAFARFGVNYELEVIVLRTDSGDKTGVFALVISDKKTGLRTSLRDVGFGVSQVLPVLVQSLISEQNTVLIEQPELHLHPRLQAELADVFIKSALERQNTFLIETHSEHLVLRLMRRVRDTTRGTLPEGIPPVRPEDVSIIYVQPTENGSVPLVMDLDEEGDLLTAWPNGFFEEGFRERFA